MDASAVAAAAPVSLEARRHLAGWALLVVAALCVVVGLVVLCRVLIGRRVLRGRARYELLPTSTCDLRWEDTHRAAWHWTNVRPSRALLVPTYASSFRLRFASDDGILHTYIEGPGASSALLRQHVYPEVESRPVGLTQQESTEPAFQPASKQDRLQADEPAGQPDDEQASPLDDLLTH